MELPLTRKQVVEDGLGHQSLGAAIIPSAGASRKMAALSPFSPCDAATTFNRGMATSSGTSSFFAPLPAVAKSRPTIWVRGSPFLILGRTLSRSSLRSPARPQKYQQAG